MDKDFNFFEAILNTNKQMTESWQETINNFTKNINAPFNISNPFEGYQKMMSSMSGSPLFSFDGSTSDIFQKMNQGAEIYYNMYKLYSDIYEKNLEPTKDNIEKVIKEYMNSTTEYMNKYIMPYLPKEVQEVLQKAEDIGTSYQSSMDAIYGPWKDNAKDLADSYAKGLFQDPEAFIEYFDKWKENYKNTFGKMLNMPMMGISRNAQQDKLQTLDRYIKYLTYSTELSFKLQTLVKETTENVIRESFEIMKTEKTPKTFEEFYNYWRDSLSRNFDRLFYSDEFSKFLGGFVDSVLSLKIQMDKVIINALKYLPIPTNKDMDSLYKTVHDLKAEVRKLRREIRNLTDELETLKKGKSK